MWMQCCAWLVAGEWDGCGYFFFWRANNLCTTFHLLMVFSFFGTIPVLAGWAMQWGNQGCQVRWRVAIDPSNGWIMSQVNVDRWSCSLLVSRTIGDIFLLAWFEAPNNFCHITFLSIIFESLKEVTIVWWWIWMFAGQQAFWNECQSNYCPPPPPECYRLRYLGMHNRACRVGGGWNLAGVFCIFEWPTFCVLFHGNISSLWWRYPYYCDVGRTRSVLRSGIGAIKVWMSSQDMEMNSCACLVVGWWKICKCILHAWAVQQRIGKIGEVIVN